MLNNTIARIICIIYNITSMTYIVYMDMYIIKLLIILYK